MLPKIPTGRLARAAALASFEIPIVVYLAAIGALGLILGPASTPNTLDDNLPGWMVFTWALLLTIGGATAFGGLLRGTEHAEAIGLILLCWPCGLYAVVLTATGGPTGTAAAAAYLALFTACILRLWVLWLSNRTRQVATRMIRDGHTDGDGSRA